MSENEAVIRTTVRWWVVEEDDGTAVWTVVSEAWRRMGRTPTRGLAEKIVGIGIEHDVWPSRSLFGLTPNQADLDRAAALRRQMAPWTLPADAEAARAVIAANKGRRR